MYLSLSEKLELVQETLFGGDGTSIADLITYSETSEYKVRQVILELKKLGLLEDNKIGKKTLYKFNLDY